MTMLLLIDALQSKFVAAGDGAACRVIADIVTVKALAADTDGAYSLFECHTAPAQGTPPHRQRYEEETCYVLEGTYTFVLDDQRIELHQGDYVFVPRGTIHAFTNTGETVGRLLVLVTPGGIHERFLAELGEPVPPGTPPTVLSGPPDVAHITAVAQKYGIEILPPPAA
jgi:quercetin dioxygenase-like cupin family protein